MPTSCGSILIRLTPKNRCRFPATGFAIAWPIRAEAPDIFQRLRLSGILQSQSWIVWSPSRSQKRHDVAELKRRVGLDAEVRLVGRPGYLQSHIHAAGLRFEIDIQNRLDARRVEERDGTLVEGVFVPEKDEFTLREVDSAEYRGIENRAANPEVRIGVQTLGQAGLKRDIRGRLQLNIEVHIPQRTRSRLRRPRWRGRAREDARYIRFRVDRDSAQRDRSGSLAAVGCAGQSEVRIRNRAYAWWIANPHVAGFGLQAESQKTFGDRGKSVASTLPPPDSAVKD